MWPHCDVSVLKTCFLWSHVHKKASAPMLESSSSADASLWRDDDECGSAVIGFHSSLWSL